MTGGEVDKVDTRADHDGRDDLGPVGQVAVSVIDEPRERPGTSGLRVEAHSMRQLLVPWVSSTTDSRWAWRLRRNAPGQGQSLTRDRCGPGVASRGPDSLPRSCTGHRRAPGPVSVFGAQGDAR
jgi:hypothetical protein